MVSVWRTFHECGLAAWGVLFASLLAAAFALVAAVLSLARLRAAKVIAGVAFVFALSPLFLGALGMFYGRGRVDDILRIESIDPAQKARIREEGYREASGCVSIGLGFTALPVLLGGTALVLALFFPKKPAVSADV